MPQRQPLTIDSTRPSGICWGRQDALTAMLLAITVIWPGVSLALDGFPVSTRDDDTAATGSNGAASGASNVSGSPGGDSSASPPPTTPTGGDTGTPTAPTGGIALPAVSETGVSGLNQNQTQILGLITDACRSQEAGSGGFSGQAYALCGESADIQRSAVQHLNPDQIFALGSLAIRVSAGQESLIKHAVAARLASLRAGQPVSPLGFHLGGGRSGGAAGDGDAFSRLGVWLNGDYRFGDQESTFKQVGFAFHNFGLTAGVDYRISDPWVAGVAFTYGRINSDFDQARGGSNSDAYSVTVYTSYHLTDALHVEATGAFTGIDYQTTRTIRYGSLAESITGRPGGSQYAFSFGGGYDLNLGGITIAPYARADYIGLNIDAYRERDTAGWAMRFADQHVDSLITTTGLQVSHAHSFSWGVLQPQFRGEWLHQFMDDRRSVAVGFVGDPSGSTTRIRNGAPDRDYFTFGASLAGQFAGGISSFVAFDTLIGYRRIDSYRLTIGARMEF